MAANPKIIALSGSTRTGSYNKILVKIAVEGAREAGADVTYIDLKDYPMPLYDGDLEEKGGLPVNARKLKDLFLLNQGLMIASPENNGSFTSVLKNAIDWLSRPVKGYPPLECFVNKYAALMGTSTGYWGAVRSVIQLRHVLSHIRVTVIPDQINVPNAEEAFAPDGTLKDKKRHDAAKALGKTLTELLRKVAG
ncbi:MAG TPA: NAD(P)H-dependent oxidoreductase [candidate division Zixibacteria bacterium]|nr:NAD(P)H-dependent oxidoreductase [candidate division Zixibacteria bacterium]